MRMRLVLCALAPALLLSGCGGDTEDPTGQAAPSTAPAEIDEEYLLADGTVAYRAGDPTFQGPGTLPAGSYSFTINNEGRFAHQMRMVRLDDDDLPLYQIADLAPEEIFELVEEIGVIKRVKPGETSSERIEVELEQGRYGFLCLLVASSGDTHADLGMNIELTVTE